MEKEAFNVGNVAFEVGNVAKKYISNFESNISNIESNISNIETREWIVVKLVPRLKGKQIVFIFPLTGFQYYISSIESAKWDGGKCIFFSSVF